MAKVSFTAIIEEITGKLAGSVFQDSYMGFQIRTRVSPANPQTNFQQLRRGEFGFISSLWRTLTDAQRQTFIDAAGTPPQALNLFIRSNVNLTLIDEPLIDTYVPSAAPSPMTVEFVSITPTEMIIRATGATTTVPAGTKLLLQVTFQKPPTKIFTNPSMYSPVISFDAGTDLSGFTDIITEWQARYGVLSANKRLCLKANVISKTNGSRSTDVVNCTTSETMAVKYIPLEAFVANVANSGAGETDLFTFTMPANTMIADKDKIVSRYSGDYNAPTSAVIRTYFAGNPSALASISASQEWWIEVHVIRTSSTTARMVTIQLGNFSQVINVLQNNLTGLNFTATIIIKITGQDTAGNKIIARSGYIDLVKAP